MITGMKGCVAYNDLWPWPISSRPFGLGLENLENRVGSVAFTVLNGFFLYMAQIITIIRGCVACYVFFQNLKIWIFGKFLKIFGLDLEKKINSSWWILSIFRTNKYWNWCRCIQRKDSARVILTASWFNNINIGYRFHTSTVCHSCCNNVMYVVVLKLYIQGKSCVRSMQASAARLRPGSGILFMTYIDICIISVW